jgi:enoyl-CoA hydratase
VSAGVLREDRDGIRVLRMSRGKANAMDLELLRALRDELESLREPSVRAGVVTGAGSIFCAGVDLKRLIDGGAAYVREFLPALEAAFLAAFSCEKPLVAAINGHAIAGGYVLANCCDRRLAADGGGRMGLPELHVGVPFPTLVMEILRATVAPPKLTELLLVGGTLPPREALAAGLIDDVSEPEDLLESACALASRLATLSPPAYAATKRNLREPAITAWRAKAADGDAAIVEQWCSQETLSAVEAFVKKTLR